MHLLTLAKRNPKSLRFRLTLLITVLTALLTTSFTSYYIIHERNTYFSYLENEGNLLISILAGSIQTPLYAGNNEDVAMLVTEIFSHGNICSARVFDGKNDQIITAVNKGLGPLCTGVTFSKAINTSAQLFSPGALLLGEETSEHLIGTVEIKLDTQHINILTRNLIIVSTLMAMALWLSATGITFLLLRKLTATFDTLMTGVKRIEDGDFSSRIQVSDFDEPGRALTAINNLAEALQKRTIENQNLQAEVVKGLRLQIDEEKSRHMAKLIQTNRMTSLGLLVSSMAHEINNPNGAIRLAAEILERAWSDVLPVLKEVAVNEGEFKICGMPYSTAIDDIEKAVYAISRSSLRIDKVVHNLRSYSLGSREILHSIIDLNRIAENAAAIVTAHGRMASIVINSNLQENLPAVSGNPFQLEQVVINLLMNAIQAMSLNNGKTINLSTETDTNSKDVLLTVQDSGPGISPEVLPHIFEPFFSTRIEQGGSGLGLYISNFIIKEQNGSLKITNDENGGCKAVIRMRIAKSTRLSQHEQEVFY